jgi:hypothetical protein
MDRGAAQRADVTGIGVVVRQLAALTTRAASTSAAVGVEKRRPRGHVVDHSLLPWGR